MTGSAIGFAKLLYLSSRGFALHTDDDCPIHDGGGKSLMEAKAVGVKVQNRLGSLSSPSTRSTPPPRSKELLSKSHSSSLSPMNESASSRRIVGCDCSTQRKIAEVVACSTLRLLEQSSSKTRSVVILPLRLTG